MTKPNLQSNSNTPALKTTKGELKTQQEAQLQNMAELTLSATATNSALAHTFSNGKKSKDDFLRTINVLTDTVNRVNSGDLADIEKTLMAQACSLNTIYCELATRAANADYIAKLQSYLRLALKAQAQCTRTLEVLSNMKNPPVVVTKQANISNAPQQVNNEFMNASRTHAHTREKNFENDKTNY